MTLPLVNVSANQDITVSSVSHHVLLVSMAAVVHSDALVMVETVILAQALVYVRAVTLDQIAINNAEMQHLATNAHLNVQTADLIRTRDVAWTQGYVHAAMVTLVHCVCPRVLKERMDLNVLSRAFVSMESVIT